MSSVGGESDLSSQSPSSSDDCRELLSGVETEDMSHQAPVVESSQPKEDRITPDKQEEEPMDIMPKYAPQCSLSGELAFVPSELTASLSKSATPSGSVSGIGSRSASPSKSANEVASFPGNVAFRYPSSPHPTNNSPSKLVADRRRKQNRVSARRSRMKRKTEMSAVIELVGQHTKMIEALEEKVALLSIEVAEAKRRAALAVNETNSIDVYAGKETFKRVNDERQTGGEVCEVPLNQPDNTTQFNDNGNEKHSSSGTASLPHEPLYQQTYHEVPELQEGRHYQRQVSPQNRHDSGNQSCLHRCQICRDCGQVLFDRPIVSQRLGDGQTEKSSLFQHHGSGVSMSTKRYPQTEGEGELEENHPHLLQTTSASMPHSTQASAFQCSSRAMKFSQESSNARSQQMLALVTQDGLRDRAGESKVTPATEEKPTHGLQETELTPQSAVPTSFPKASLLAERNATLDFAGRQDRFACSIPMMPASTRFSTALPSSKGDFDTADHVGGDEQMASVFTQSATPMYPGGVMHGVDSYSGAYAYPSSSLVSAEGSHLQATLNPLAKSALSGFRASEPYCLQSVSSAGTDVALDSTGNENVDARRTVSPEAEFQWSTDLAAFQAGHCSVSGVVAPASSSRHLPSCRTGSCRESCCTYAVSPANMGSTVDIVGKRMTSQNMVFVNATVPSQLPQSVAAAGISEFGLSTDGLAQLLPEYRSMEGFSPSCLSGSLFSPSVLAATLSHDSAAMENQNGQFLREAVSCVPAPSSESYLVSSTQEPAHTHSDLDATNTTAIQLQDQNVWSVLGSSSPTLADATDVVDQSPSGCGNVVDEAHGSHLIDELSKAWPDGASFSTDMCS